MQRPYTRLPAIRLLATGTALSLLFGSAAFAADADAVAERLKAVYNEQGSSINYTGVKANGADIILEGTTVALTISDSDKITIGDITLQNVQDTPDGGYSVQHVIVPDFTIQTPASAGDDEVEEADGETKPAAKKAEKITKEDTITRFSGMTFDNMLIPSEKASSPIDKLVIYDRMQIADIEIGTPKTDGASIKGIDLTFDTSNKAEKISYTWNIASINAKFPEGDGKAASSFGTDTLDASMSSKGSWSPKTGDMTLDQFEVQAKDIGKLSISLSMGGYDLAFLDAVEQTQKALKESKEQDDSAAGLAFLTLAQQLNIKHMSIRFDNDQLVQKLLEHYAKEQGTDATMLGNQLKAMAPMLAAQLKDPELTQKLSNAVSTFISDPKSLTISATPNNPVTFATIAATASIDPTKIIQLLKVGVDANN